MLSIHVQENSNDGTVQIVMEQSWCQDSPPWLTDSLRCQDSPQWLAEMASVILQLTAGSASL